MPSSIAYVILICSLQMLAGRRIVASGRRIVASNAVLPESMDPTKDDDPYLAVLKNLALALGWTPEAQAEIINALPSAEIAGNCRRSAWALMLKHVATMRPSETRAQYLVKFDDEEDKMAQGIRRLKRDLVVQLVTTGMPSRRELEGKTADFRHGIKPPRVGAIAPISICADTTNSVYLKMAKRIDQNLRLGGRKNFAKGSWHPYLHSYNGVDYGRDGGSFLSDMDDLDAIQCVAIKKQLKKIQKSKAKPYIYTVEGVNTVTVQDPIERLLELSSIRNAIRIKAGGMSTDDRSKIHVLEDLAPGEVSISYLAAENHHWVVLKIHLASGGGTRYYWGDANEAAPEKFGFSFSWKQIRPYFLAETLGQIVTRPGRANKAIYSNANRTAAPDNKGLGGVFLWQPDEVLGSWPFYRSLAEDTFDKKNAKCDEGKDDKCFTEVFVDPHDGERIKYARIPAAITSPQMPAIFIATRKYSTLSLRNNDAQCTAHDNQLNIVACTEVSGK